LHKNTRIRKRNRRLTTDIIHIHKTKHTIHNIAIIIGVFLLCKTAECSKCASSTVSYALNKNVFSLFLNMPSDMSSTRSSAARQQRRMAKWDASYCIPLSQYGHVAATKLRAFVVNGFYGKLLKICKMRRQAKKTAKSAVTESTLILLETQTPFNTMYPLPPFQKPAWCLEWGFGIAVLAQFTSMKQDMMLLPRLF